MSAVHPAWQSADEEADPAAADQRALHASVKNASNPSPPAPFVAQAALLEREGNVRAIPPPGQALREAPAPVLEPVARAAQRNANPVPGPVPAIPALPVVWEHVAPPRAPAHVPDLEAETYVAPPRAPSNPPPPPPYVAPVGCLEQLLDMGFSREQALWALTSENGNLEAATHLLLAAAAD